MFPLFISPYLDQVTREIRIKPTDVFSCWDWWANFLHHEMAHKPTRQQKLVGCFLQSIWKICASQIEISPRFGVIILFFWNLKPHFYHVVRGQNTWNHHPEYVLQDFNAFRYPHSLCSLNKHPPFQQLAAFYASSCRSRGKVPKVPETDSLLPAVPTSVAAPRTPAPWGSISLHWFWGTNNHSETHLSSAIYRGG